MRIRFFLPLVSAAALAAAAGAGCERRRDPGHGEEAAVAAADVGPCREGSKWHQRHGTSCLCCHQEFGVAGSVLHDAGIATVLVTDRNGEELEIAPNPFDNFFRHHKMTPPLRAQIVFRDGEVRTMEHAAPHGSCNACHGETVKPLGER
jgi:hypothetical protein